MVLLGERLLADPRDTREDARRHLPATSIARETVSSTEILAHPRLGFGTHAVSLTLSGLQRTAVYWLHNRALPAARILLSRRGSPPNAHDITLLSDVPST
jgi:hypothetical protein